MVDKNHLPGSWFESYKGLFLTDRPLNFSFQEGLSSGFLGSKVEQANVGDILGFGHLVLYFTDRSGKVTSYGGQRSVRAYLSGKMGIDRG